MRAQTHARDSHTHSLGLAHEAEQVASAQVGEGQTSIKCPEPKCGLRVTESLIRALCGAPTLQRYQHFLNRSFVDDSHHKVRWRPLSMRLRPPKQVSGPNGFLLLLSFWFVPWRLTAVARPWPTGAAAGTNRRRKKHRPGLGSVSARLDAATGAEQRPPQTPWKSRRAELTSLALSPKTQPKHAKP